VLDDAEQKLAVWNERHDNNSVAVLAQDLRRGPVVKEHNGPHFGRQSDLL